MKVIAAMIQSAERIVFMVFARRQRSATTTAGMTRAGFGSGFRCFI